MSRVLVVDDEVNLSRALRHLLEREGHLVEVVHDGLSALSATATFAPDLMILDLGLPDLDGIEVVTRVRSWWAAPILILSGADQEERKVAALGAGADDYLVKPFGVRELVARVGALLRRPGAEPAGQQLRFGDLAIDLIDCRVEVAGEETRLTPTEWRLLEGFVTHPGKLLTHQWLLERAWDDSYGGETRQALRVHLRSLRAKLGDDATTPRYIRTESGAGYRWVSTTEQDGAASEPSASEPPASEAPGPETPGPETQLGGAGQTARATELTHAINNALAAIQLSTHRALEPEPQTEDGGGKAVEEELRRLDRLTRQVGEMVSELRGLVSPG